MCCLSARLYGGMMCLVLLAGAVCSQPAWATPAIMLGPDLKPQLIQLHSLQGESILFFDQNRTLKTRPVTDCLQLRLSRAPVEPAAPPQQPIGVIRLTDGQQIAGHLVDVQDERITWRHPRLGTAMVSLEQVMAIAFDSPLPRRIEPGGDELHLTNGDVVGGFVEALTSQAVTLRPAGQQPMDLPLNRVKQIRLANPPTPPDPPGPGKRGEQGEQGGGAGGAGEAGGGVAHMIYLADGSRLLVTGLSIQGDQVSCESAAAFGRPLTLKLADVQRIDLKAGPYRLMELADLSWQQQAGGEAFGVTVPVQISDGVFHLHAPVVVRIELPQGARRLAAMLQLNEEQADPAQLAWADFIVTLRDQSGTRIEQPINLRSRRSSVTTDLTGPSLWIELDPAANGPVMDRLLITDGLLLIEN